jgi:DNA-binding protein H-NS
MVKCKINDEEMELRHLEAEIEKAEIELQRLKERKATLENSIKQNKFSELGELFNKSGLTFDELKDLIIGNKAKTLAIRI